MSKLSNSNVFSGGIDVDPDSTCDDDGAVVILRFITGLADDDGEEGDSIAGMFDGGRAFCAGASSTCGDDACMSCVGDCGCSVD